jgi:hypothetical protein
VFFREAFNTCIRGAEVNRSVDQQHLYALDSPETPLLQTRQSCTVQQQETVIVEGSHPEHWMLEKRRVSYGREGGGEESGYGESDLWMVCSKLAVGGQVPR